MTVGALALREKCPYLEFFLSVFSRIRTEYGEILYISSYSVRIWENKDQKNSEYGHFSCSVGYVTKFLNSYMNDFGFNHEEIKMHVNKMHCIVSSGAVKLCKTFSNFEY